ncbi:MAG: nuclease-related domain-containing protein [Streptosporangiaceae bacterium]
MAWLRGALAVRRVQRQAPLPHARSPAPSGREGAMRPGAGRAVRRRGPGWRAGDERTLLRGYRNRRGEIDHLLLGPPGLAAIKVKNRNCLISCTGDRWLITRHDRYGNRVSAPQPFTDNGGRPLAQRAAQPARRRPGRPSCAPAAIPS